MTFAIGLLLSRVLLAGVFLVAGLAKVRERATFRAGLVRFGTPEPAATLVALILPWIEVATGVMLLPLSTAWWGAASACALLLIFAAAIARNLARGDAPDCNCFGQLHAAPVSWPLVARNLALAAIAVFILVAGRGNAGASAFIWLGDLRAGEVAMLSVGLVALGLLTTTLFGVRRLLAQHAALLARVEAAGLDFGPEDGAEPQAPAPAIERPGVTAPVEGLPVGAAAPAFTLQALGGERLSLSSLLAEGHPLLLLFVSPTCNPCKSLLPIVRAWERDYEHALTVALISRGTVDENRERVAKYGARRLLLQAENEVAAAYQSNWTPAAVIVGRDGRIATKATYGNEAIRAMVTHAIATGIGMGAAGEASRRSEITVGKSLFRIGEPAPVVSLADVHGRQISTRDLAAVDGMLLLFWDPGCRFCQALAPELKLWEDTRPADAPRLAFVASGDLDAIAAQSREFSSPTLVDPGFDVAPLFGATSTPSAVLVDRQGRIASSLAVGAADVLALAGVRSVIT